MTFIDGIEGRIVGMTVDANFSRPGKTAFLYEILETVDNMDGTKKFTKMRANINFRSGGGGSGGGGGGHGRGGGGGGGHEYRSSSSTRTDMGHGGGGGYRGGRSGTSSHPTVHRSAAPPAQDRGKTKMGEMDMFG